MPILNKPTRTHVYSVHWKHQKQFADEIFSTLKSLSTKYPQYDEEALDKYFKEKKRKYEDDNAIISRIRISYEPEETVVKPVFPDSMFWEFPYEKIDWIKAYRTVIQRVLERGEDTDWEKLLNYYGYKRLSNTIRNEILYLPDHVIDKVCKYFDFNKEDLLCYIRKQLMPKHWI
jgi:hypothetical protein